MYSENLLVTLNFYSNENILLINLQRDLFEKSGDLSLLETEPFIPLTYLATVVTTERELNKISEKIKQLLKENNLIKNSTTFTIFPELYITNNLLFLKVETQGFLNSLRENLVKGEPSIFRTKPIKDGNFPPLLNGVYLGHPNSLHINTHLETNIKTIRVRKMTINITRIRSTEIEILWETKEIKKLYFA